ncbi:hypothetical protein M9H77_11379 [Catharanthus roseus]|uniref:Uncharacterized protein n=1 Tax=Catharanthus roseus TaxID=4058 RepID=A0ACC0BEC8_CATRO|nr:hypothetical protein M9H77_11379 [Catharanthus roseus]
MEEKDEEFGTMEIVKAIGVVAAVGLELGVPISFSVLVTVFLVLKLDVPSLQLGILSVKSSHSSWISEGEKKKKKERRKAGSNVRMRGIGLVIEVIEESKFIVLDKELKFEIAWDWDSIINVNATTYHRNS